MSATAWEGVISSVVGIVFVVVSRLIDRYLPDPKGEHPLPTEPPDLGKHVAQES